MIIFATALLGLAMLTGCGPTAEELEAVNYAPLPGDDLEMSTPAKEGLDQDLIAQLCFGERV